RLACSNCKKMVRFFCYHCQCLVNEGDRARIPQVKLPVKLDILKHHHEKDGKSTAVHAKILAPEDTTIYSYPNNPITIDDPSRCLLLFPGPDAHTLEQIDPQSFDRVIVIDGTWKQARAMARTSPELNTLRKVTIRPRTTCFWRFQQDDDAHMATIEAIYFLYREYYEAYLSSASPNLTATAMDYDNLLFYFKYFYRMIQNIYRANRKKTYCRRHQAGYI
ncbi:DTW domain-containing protein, partial [Dimargaris cristalligena]